MTDPSPDPRFRVERRDDELALGFPPNAAWVQAIKQLRARRFDPDQKAWFVPVSQAPDALLALEVAGAPDAWLDGLRPWAREALADAAGALASRQARYELAMPGLAERYPLLFRHQLEGVRFLLSPRGGRGAILADEMGLGKTRQAIVAAHEATDGEILVVCPAGLKLNWAREIGLALGEGQAVTVVGRQAFTPARWTIINYDRLAAHQDALMAHRWPIVILDEAHYVKNRHARRTRLLVGGEPKRNQPRQPGLLSRAGQAYLLTGTPLTNRPLDLFPLLQAIQHPLGDDLMAFAARYCAAFYTGYGWDMKGASHLDELHERMQDVLLRRVKEEVLDLPPKLRTYLPVEVDLRAYRQVWLDHVAKKRKGRQRRGKRALLAEIAKLRVAAAVAKIPAAGSFVEDVLAQGEKVIVFSQYHAVIDALAERFGEAAVRVTGRHGPRAREAAVQAFQQDDAVRVFLGNLKAAGVGVSLTAATQVVFVDYSFVPADHLQAEDRPYRIGQHAGVTVTYMSAVETIDEEVEQLLAQKLDVIGRAIEGAEPSLTTSFVDDLLAILARREETP